ncbi:MAG TPA: class II aldolase/adducin family protein [Bacteroidales bacterium]|nr:class II aldolase/adducin family protein [Bacteroidales bacterium]
MSKEEYGGVKFKTVFVQKPWLHHPFLEELKKWCAVFHEKGLSPPYPGGSYGNLSFRTQNNSFIITGTSIGLKGNLDNTCFVEVTHCDVPQKNVYAKGFREPSSESFMHYIIYKNRPDIHAIFHGHHEPITQNAVVLGIPETIEKTSYGSVALAESVLKILDHHSFIVIKEHGFVSMAETMQQAGQQTLQYLQELKNVMDL